MLRFSGKKLHADEKRIITQAAKFTLNKFLTPAVQKKILIEVRLTDHLNGWSGETVYMGNDDGIKKFEVAVCLKLDKRAKKPHVRMKDPILTLMHELVHVKQYVNSELFDYVDGRTRWKGAIYENSKDMESYYDSPWEIEAYGRTEGLWDLFNLKLKKDAKAK
jgi:hypothetical protein